MANTYMKRCSMLLVTREKKIKTNRDATTHAIRRTTIKNDNPRCWQRPTAFTTCILGLREFTLCKTVCQCLYQSSIYPMPETQKLYSSDTLDRNEYLCSVLTKRNAPEQSHQHYLSQFQTTNYPSVHQK